MEKYSVLVNIITSLYHSSHSESILLKQVETGIVLVLEVVANMQVYTHSSGMVESNE